jgi:hypothetical protein
MKMTVFWDVPCSLVETDRCFRGVYRLYQDLTEKINTSKSAINFYHCCNILEDQSFSNCGPREFARWSAAVSKGKISQKLYKTLNE